MYCAIRDTRRREIDFALSEGEDYDPRLRIFSLFVRFRVRVHEFLIF